MIFTQEVVALFVVSVIIIAFVYYNREDLHDSAGRAYEHLTGAPRQFALGKSMSAAMGKSAATGAEIAAHIEAVNKASSKAAQNWTVAFIPDFEIIRIVDKTTGKSPVADAPIEQLIKM
jgi:hypothetical protein